jgi:hypothetical protein
MTSGHIGHDVRRPPDHPTHLAAGLFKSPATAQPVLRAPGRTPRCEVAPQVVLVKLTGGARGAQRALRRAWIRGSVKSHPEHAGRGDGLGTVIGDGIGLCIHASQRSSSNLTKKNLSVTLRISRWLDLLFITGCPVMSDIVDFSCLVTT